MAKRTFDFVAALIGLVFLLPFLVIVMIAIKIDSTGPIFFRQKRVGLQGKLFKIHKFRTMVVDAEKKGLQVTAGLDPRITRIGKLLRKYKIDELPQLLDVLQGTMSIVGPRPEVPRYVEHYPNGIREKVLSVRPGITDRASIEFKDENSILGNTDNPQDTYINEILPVKLRYYTEYVDTRSFWKDIVIIIKTLRSIV